VVVWKADDPVHRYPYQRAHEQLAPHNVWTTNQHDLRMEGDEMSLRILHPNERGFQPYERGWYHRIHNHL